MQKIDSIHNIGIRVTQNIVIITPEGVPGLDLVRAAKEAGYSTILAIAEPVDRYQNLMPYLSIEMCKKRGLCNFVIREDDPQHLLEKLKKFQIAAVIPGSEIAVNISDKIASVLGGTL